ncbi:MAG TPA: tetratricopeptide repeat protein [Candidatus Dormibacteraeota bacterium]|nr:tetratricopeptide repeat protein [Candidatus Dormibacteraeota bacterium]
MGKPSFGELLCGYRSAVRLTQEELAARAGLSVDAISLLERGARTPRGTTVALLASALGLGPAEREAFAASVRRSPALTTALEASHVLRLWSSKFVGRQAELARAGELLARPDVRLLTLTGPPGAGKTRLAMEIASRLAPDYGDGTAVVTLGPLDDPALVMPAVRQALGLRETGAESALDTVVANCRTRHQLLVLDNFEHVLPAGLELVELLAACPRLRILVTSQAALRVRPEHRLTVPPLPLPEPSVADEALGAVASVALFVERAQAAAPGFRLNAGNAAAVAAVCRRLDGLPLALELAAPWIRLLSPEQLLERLDRRLDLLVEGPRDLPERQRTLRAALVWSCEQLGREPLALLRRLSVFAGSAPLDDLAVVCQAAGPLPGGVLRHLAVLADHSLVLRQEGAGAQPRVTMLESVREYARELLAVAGELEATAQAHLERYAGLAARSRDELRGPDQESWLRRLRTEHDNVRAALAWSAEHGDAETGLRLAGALWLFWDYDGHRREGLEWLERLLAASGSDRSAVRAQALHAAGRLAEGVSCEQSIARHEESLTIYRELGDRRGVVACLRGLALAAGNQGDHRRAIELLEEAVPMLRGMDQPALLASALMNLGVAVSHHGDPPRSKALYEEALAIRRRTGDALGTALCLINLGGRARAEGDLPRSGALLDEAVTIARRLGSPYHLAAALANLGDLERARGDASGAGARYRESLGLFAGIGERSGVGVCLRWLGWVAWADGRMTLAARRYGAADALCPMAGAPDISERATHERVRAALRGRLGEAGYAAARQAGSRLSLDEAVAEATCPGSDEEAVGSVATMPGG